MKASPMGKMERTDLRHINLIRRMLPSMKKSIIINILLRTKKYGLFTLIFILSTSVSRFRVVISFESSSFVVSKYL